MPSTYVKCDDCPAVVDRYPKEIDPNKGSFGRYNWSATRRYARSIGWYCADDYAGKDYCPEHRKAHGL